MVYFICANDIDRGTYYVGIYHSQSGNVASRNGGQMNEKQKLAANQAIAAFMGDQL